MTRKDPSASEGDWGDGDDRLGQAMRTRQLGSQGPDITTVGFGAWAIGGPWKFGWGAQDDDDSIAAIRHAIDSGINWIDTAAVYGLGHSEEVTGRALEPYRLGTRSPTTVPRRWPASSTPMPPRAGSITG